MLESDPSTPETAGEEAGTLGFRLSFFSLFPGLKSDKLRGSGGSPPGLILKI